MSTTDRTSTRARTSGGGLAAWESNETKPSWKTTELLVLAAAVAGVLIAAAIADNLDARQAWTLVTILAAGYMISRGIAKAGARHWGNGYGDER